MRGREGGGEPREMTRGLHPKAPGSPGGLQAEQEPARLGAHWCRLAAAGRTDSGEGGEGKTALVPVGTRGCLRGRGVGGLQVFLRQNPQDLQMGRRGR